MCNVFSHSQAFILSIPAKVSPQLYEEWLRAVWDLACSTMDMDERARHLLSFSQLVLNRKIRWMQPHLSKQNKSGAMQKEEETPPRSSRAACASYCGGAEGHFRPRGLGNGRGLRMCTSV